MVSFGAINVEMEGKSSTVVFLLVDERFFMNEMGDKGRGGLEGELAAPTAEVRFLEEGEVLRKLPSFKRGDEILLESRCSSRIDASVDELHLLFNTRSSSNLAGAGLSIDEAWEKEMLGLVP